MTKSYLFYCVFSSPSTQESPEQSGEDPDGLSQVTVGQVLMQGVYDEHSSLHCKAVKVIQIHLIAFVQKKMAFFFGV